MHTDKPLSEAYNFRELKRPPQKFYSKFGTSSLQFSKLNSQFARFDWIQFNTFRCWQVAFHFRERFD